MVLTENGWVQFMEPVIPRLPNFSAERLRKSANFLQTQSQMDLEAYLQIMSDFLCYSYREIAVLP